MAFQLKKIRLHELEAFTDSPIYRNADLIPISKNRVQSYVNNPRADKDDFVLYLMLDEQKIVGFRTLFADVISILGKEVKFAWLSGSWVHPDHRRKGISSQLFHELFADWKGQILYTNYAPNSKALYDKSEKFDLLIQKKGIRFYLRAHFAMLLKERHKLFSNFNFIIKGVDLLINGVLSPWYFIINHQGRKLFQRGISQENVSTDVFEFMAQHPASSFNRGQKEYTWIMDYPWVTTENKDKADYPFSSFAKSFYYQVIKQTNDQGRILGLALLKIRDGIVTVPYYFNQADADFVMAKAILGYCYSIRAKSLTSYHKALVEVFAEKSHKVLFKKMMLQKYFVSKEFEEQHQNEKWEIEVLDGDGDCIFT